MTVMRKKDYSDNRNDYSDDRKDYGDIHYGCVASLTVIGKKDYRDFH